MKKHVQHGLGQLAGQLSYEIVQYLASRETVLGPYSTALIASWKARLRIVTYRSVVCKLVVPWRQG